jgi:hypothetical protein
VSKSSKVDSPARRLSNLTGQGGTASGWSAWLNFGYIGSFPGIVRAASGALAVSFANIALQVVSISENVLTVGMDHSDHDQAALSPPGILGAALLSMSNTTFTKWTIVGNAGTGESNIDAIRGVIAEVSAYSTCSTVSEPHSRVVSMLKDLGGTCLDSMTCFGRHTRHPMVSTTAQSHFPNHFSTGCTDRLQCFSRIHCELALRPASRLS